MNLLLIAWRFLSSGTGKIIGYSLAIISVGGILFKMGESKERNEGKVKELEEFVETTKDIQDATEDAPSDYDAAREWLLRRSQDKR